MKRKLYFQNDGDFQKDFVDKLGTNGTNQIDHVCMEDLQAKIMTKIRTYRRVWNDKVTY